MEWVEVPRIVLNDENEQILLLHRKTYSNESVHAVSIAVKNDVGYGFLQAQINGELNALWDSMLARQTRDPRGEVVPCRKGCCAATGDLPRDSFPALS
jgi:hypothetical protein